MGDWKIYPNSMLKARAGENLIQNELSVMQFNWEMFRTECWKLLERSDWSKYKELRDRKIGDWDAAMRLIFGEGARHVTPEALIQVSLRQVGYYMDENHMACSHEQTFMDLSDDMKFPAGAMDQITEWVTQSVMNRLGDQGFKFITEPEGGIYVFRPRQEVSV